MMETETKELGPTGVDAGQELAGRPGPARLAALRRALEGALFPLGREHLLRVARENDAPAVLLTLMAGLPAQRYASVDEVERRLPDGA